MKFLIRKASDGLVGIARHDGEVGAANVLKYLETAPDGTSISAQELVTQLELKGVQTVTKADLEHLARAEEQEAQARGVPWYKFGHDHAMLKAIEEQKTKGSSG